MSYTKTNWENLPSTNTPINATNLNKIEQGIKDNSDDIDLLKGTVLYNNASGTTGNITTLNDNINNYNYFEIISYVVYSGTNVYTTTGKLPIASIDRVHINNIFVGGTGVYNSGFQVTSKRVSISGTTLSVVSDRQYNSGPGSQSDGNFTYITKILGYK